MQDKIFSRNNQKKIDLILIIILIAAPIVFVSIHTVVRMNYKGIFSENAITGTPNYNNTFYVTPIMELFTLNPDVDNHELELIEFMLGPSEKYYRVGFSVSQWYSENIVNNSGIWTWIQQCFIINSIDRLILACLCFFT